MSYLIDQSSFYAYAAETKKGRESIQMTTINHTSHNPDFKLSKIKVVKRMSQFVSNLNHFHTDFSTHKVVKQMPAICLK